MAPPDRGHGRADLAAEIPDVSGVGKSADQGAVERLTVHGDDLDAGGTGGDPVRMGAAEGGQD